MELFAKNLEEIRLLIEDPKLHVYDVVHEALRQVDLNREESFKLIEETSLKSYDQIEDFEQECYKNILSNDLKQIFRSQIDSYDSLKSLLETPTRIKSNLNLLNSKCRNLISSMKEILLKRKNLVLLPGFLPQTFEVKIENV